MPWDKFYREYDKRLADVYPSISALKAPWQNRTVVSPYKIYLSQSVIDWIVEAVDNIYRLSRQNSYRESILPDPLDREILSSPAPNLSVLMSYDFHLDGETPRLLEINTNASGYLIASALYQMHAQTGPFPQALDSLKNSFFEEFKRFGIKGAPHIAILDEEPRTQKMFPEFLLYTSLFESWGCTASIHDVNELTYLDGALFAGRCKIDFIYNRYCDFTLSAPSSNILRRAYSEGACCFSPNPKEYILLADKRRLVPMSRSGWLESVASSDIAINTIRNVLIPTWHLNDFEDVDTVWRKRKRLFFKPAQSYGGKGAFRGRSITHKAFARLMNGEPLIQAYVPAPTVTFENDDTGSKWKFDIRAYAYGGEVQLVIARIYQGQITNFNNAYGGYCPIFVK